MSDEHITEEEIAGGTVDLDSTGMPRLPVVATHVQELIDDAVAAVSASMGDSSHDPNPPSPPAASVKPSEPENPKEIWLIWDPPLGVAPVPHDFKWFPGLNNVTPYKPFKCGQQRAPLVMKAHPDVKHAAAEHFIKQEMDVPEELAPASAPSSE